MKYTGYLLLLLMTSPFAKAEGRLFYSQTERTGLEHARQHRVTEREASLPKLGDSPLTFNGLVIRSDGQNTRWINGRPVSGFVRAPAYKGHALKPGQTVANGKIYEPHQIIRENTP
jgi:hypothetical protein